MPTMIAVNAVQTTRNGKRVRIKSGQAFDFTEDEIEHLGDKVRAPKADLATAKVVRAEDGEAPVDPLTPAARARQEKEAAKKAAEAKKTGGKADLSDI